MVGKLESLLCKILPCGELFIFVEMIVDANNILAMSFHMRKNA